MPDLENGAALNFYGDALRAYDNPPEPDVGASWLDVPRELGASVAETAAVPLSAGQVATAGPEYSPEVSDWFAAASKVGHSVAESLRAGESKISRRAAEAKLFPEAGEPSFTDTPIRSAVMQGAGMAGFGGVLAGAAAIAPEGFLAGLITDAAAGGTFGAMQVADKAAQFYNDPDLTDQKLAEQDPRFNMLVEQGVGPKEARRIRMQETIHAAPLFANGLAGALGMGVGGRVLGRTVGGSGNAISRLALGAGEGAAGMGAMGAAGSYADQDQEIAQGRRTDFDFRKMWMAGANYAALGTALGGLGGVLHKSDGRRLGDERTARATDIERVDPVTGLDTTIGSVLSDVEVAPPPVDLSKLSAPGSKPLESNHPRSQGLDADQAVAMGVGERVKEAEKAPESVAPVAEPVAPVAPVAEPVAPIVHPGEPEKPVDAIAHPDVTEIAPKPEVTPEAPEPVARTPVVPTGRILQGPRWGEGPEWSPLQGQAKPEKAAASGVANWTKAELEQRTKNHEIAKRILGASTPFEPITENNHQVREKIRERLQAQVSDALASGMGIHNRNKGGAFENRIPGKVAAMPGEIQWLREAESFLKKLNNKKVPTKNEINKFIGVDRLAHEGAFDTIAEKRATEGAAFGAAKRKATERPPEEGGSGGVDTLESKEPSPEDILLAHEEALNKQLKEQSKEQPKEQISEPTPGRERTAPALLEEPSKEPSYTAAKAREAPVVTTRGRSRYEGMRPKVAEKVKLSLKGNLKDKLEKESKAAEPLAAFDRNEQGAKQALLDNTRETADDVLTVRSPRTTKPEQAKAVITMNQAFNTLGRHNVETHLAPIQKALYPIFKKRLMTHVGDMQVFIVDKEQMRRLFNKDGKTPSGYYEPLTKHIVVRDDVMRNPHNAAWILIHEGLHGAYRDIINSDPKIRATVERMIGEVRAHLDANPHIEQTESLTYGLKNAHEFVSEAFSNHLFQDLLTRVDVSPELAREMGLGAARKRTMWDLFVASVRSLLGMPKGTHSMLEAALRIAQDVDAGRVQSDLEKVRPMGEPKMRELLAAPERISLESERTLTENMRGFLDKGTSLAQSAANPIETVSKTLTDMAYSSRGGASTAGKILRYVETSDQIRQRVEKYWPGFLDNNTVRKVFDGIQRQGTRATELKKVGNRISERMARIQKRVPGAYRDFASLVHEATMFGVDPASALGSGRNSYLAFNKKVQAKLDKGASLQSVMKDVNHAHIEAVEEHARLKSDYDALVAKHPEFAKLMDDTFSFFHDAQQEITRGHLQNILRAVSRGDQGAEHVVKRRADELLDARKSEEHREGLVKEFEGNEGTAEQRRKVGEAVADQIYDAKAFSGREGPYAPLMRHGDWVVHGRYKIKAPSNAIQQIGPNVFEFATKEEAIDFARSTGLHRTYDTAYYDPLTGERTTKLGGLSQAGTSEQRWAVTLNDKHVEFHTRKSDALKAYDLYKNDPNFEVINQPEKRKENMFLQGELSHRGMDTIVNKLEAQQHYQKATSEEKLAMRRALEEASISMMGGNRMQSRRLPRRRVEGYSNDLTGNFDIYNQSQANFRAKQEWRPRIDQALKDLREQHEAAAYAKPQDPVNTIRSEYLEEIENRARAPDPNSYTGAWANFTRQLSTWSYIYRMGRASHLILHQTHLPMITAPIIAGRHNVFKAYGATLHAWKELSGAYKRGGVDVYKSLADSLHEGTDYATWFRDATKSAPDAARLHKMAAELESLGIVHSQYEVEIQRHLKSQERGGLLGAPMRFMNHFDTVFRHATNATEMINRYAGAMASYRLEYAKMVREGKTKSEAHDLAVEYARNTVANTQGLYSSTNAAPLFKNKVLRPFLQFKQFPQMIYNLMATNLIKTVKGATPREKIEAASSFLALLGTHTLMTGVLGGVPLEAAKIGATVTKGLGLTSGDWSDVERWQYEQAVNMFGKTGADYIMHGLSRMLGVDAHHRLGLNSFYTFGLPEGAENNAKNVWAFLGQQALGAPGGLFADGLRATHKIMSGDVADGMAQLAPQQLRDVYKAWRGGGKDYKYSGGEAVARILGFTPSGEAEHYERKAQTRSQLEEYNQERRSLMRKWDDAKDKSDVMAKIQKFNKNKPKEAQITLKQLTSSAERRKRAEEKGEVVHGVRLNKQTKFIGERAAALY